MKLKPYPKYKDSGVEWVGEVPSGWTHTKLKHMATFSTGWTPPTGNDSAYNGENLWANISDLGDRVIYDTAKRISDEAVSKANIPISPKGSLLFSFKLSIGQVSFAGEAMYTNEAIASFPPDQGINVRYGYYAYPLFLVQNASENIYGAKLLNQDLMKNAQIVLPDLHEQTTIATFLDRETAKLDTLIAKQEKLIELLQEKRQAVISHAVTKGLDPDVPMKDSGVEWLGMVPAHWEVKRLKFVAPLSTAKVEASKTNLPYVGMENVESATGKFIDVEDQAEAEGTSNYFRRDDVLFGKLRPYLAKALHAEWEGICSSEFLVLRGVDVLPSFLLRYLLSTELIKQVDSSTYGSKMPRASWDFIGNLPMPVPSKSDQTEIVDYLTNESKKFDTLIERAKRSIELAKEHRTALISAAVTGKIDVREAA